MFLSLKLGLGGTKLRSPDQIKNTVVKTRGICKEYDVCVNSCYLFMDDDQAVDCPNPKCKEKRFKDNSKVSRKIMPCVSIGEALTQMLLDDDNRELFDYKPTFNLDDNQLVDIFSGQDFKRLHRKGVIGEKDICLVMYVDGFQNKHKPGHSQTMIHSIIMNLDPSVR